MRIRTIKPEFWSDEKIGKLSRNARLLFIGLWSIADDFGVARSNLRWINAQLFPYDHLSIKNLRTWLSELLNLGFIEEFSSKDETYFNIKHFKNHQVINRPSKFRNPEPPILTEDSVNTHGTLNDGSGIGIGTGNGKGGVMEVGGESEGRKEEPKVNSLSLSKEGNKKEPTQVIELVAESLGIPKKDNHLHEWFVKEQASIIKKHGFEFAEKMDWIGYVKQHYLGLRA